jgi:iron complex outermembrane receptor protein
LEPPFDKHLIGELDRAIQLDLTYDKTRATNDSFKTNLPRIPTRRLGLRYEYAIGPWLRGADAWWSDEASHLSPNQFPNDSYIRWGAEIHYSVHATDSVSVDLFAVSTNLADEEERPQTSFLKDRVPMPNRSVRL